jgi:putative membrane protein
MAEAMRFLVRLFLNGVAILVAAWLVPGLQLDGPGSALLAGVILGFVNAIIRPVLFFLTLPFTLLTLGLFIFVLNAICLGLTAAVLPGFGIASYWSALLGAFVVTVVSWILNGLLVGKEERRVHVTVRRRH